MTDQEIAQIGIEAAEHDALWLAGLCQCALGLTPTPLGRINVTRPVAKAWLEALRWVGSEANVLPPGNSAERPRGVTQR